MKKLFIKYAISKRLHLIEILILANVYFIFFRSNLFTVLFHPDETYWIVCSTTRFDEFIRGNFSSHVWDENFGSLEVRPISGYFVSFSQRLAGITPSQLPPTWWDWTVDMKTNIDNGAIPNKSAIYYSRLPMFILTIISFIITLISLSVAHSRLAAYCFFAFSFSRFFLENLSRAMCESPLLFFSILSIIAIFLLLQAIKKEEVPKIFLYSALAGIFCGIAGQSKLNGLLCVFIALVVPIIAVLKYKVELKNAKVKILLISTITIIFFSVLIFIAIYPFLYHDTIQRIIETFLCRQRVMNLQIANNIDVILPGQRTKILLNRIFSYPINLPGFLILNMCITIFGIFYVLRNIFKKRNNKRGNIYLILVIAAIILCVPILFTPLDWERYYLFPIYFTCIFFSIGICQFSLLLINAEPKQIKDFLKKDNLISYVEKKILPVHRLFKLFHNSSF